MVVLLQQQQLLLSKFNQNPAKLSTNNIYHKHTLLLKCTQMVFQKYTRKLYIELIYKYIYIHLVWRQLKDRAMHLAYVILLRLLGLHFVVLSKAVEMCWRRAKSPGPVWHLTPGLPQQTKLVENELVKHLECHSLN